MLLSKEPWRGGGSRFPRVAIAAAAAVSPLCRKQDFASWQASRPENRRRIWSLSNRLDGIMQCDHVIFSGRAVCLSVPLTAGMAWPARPRPLSHTYHFDAVLVPEKEAMRCRGNEREMLSVYRSSHLLMRLGWDDFHLGVPSFSPFAPAASASVSPSRSAEPRH